MSYKPNVDDFRESPSVRIAIKASKAFDIPIYCVDPEISKISGRLDTTCRFLDAVVIEPDSLYLLLVNHSCFISSLDLIDKDTSSLLLKFC